MLAYKVDDIIMRQPHCRQKPYITGPQSEVSKISKVVAAANIDGTLNSSRKVNADIILYDADGKEINTDFIFS